MNLRITRRDLVGPIMLSPLAVAAVSCATIEGWLKNPAIAAGIQDAFDVAVGVIFPQLGGNAIAIANEVLSVIATLIALAQKNTTTVATIGTDAVNVINTSNLSAPIKAALTNVVGFAAGILAEQVNAVPQTAAGELTTVFTDIQSALQLFVGGAKSAQGKAALTRMGVHL